MCLSGNSSYLEINVTSQVISSLGRETAEPIENGVVCKVVRYVRLVDRKSIDKI